MRRVLYILTILIAFQFNLAAQETTPTSPAKPIELPEGYEFVGIGGRLVPPFDTYGEITEEEVSIRLDRFAKELDQNPGLVGYILAVGRTNQDFDNSAERLEAAKTYLTTVHAIDQSRIVTGKQCGGADLLFVLRIDEPLKYLSNSPPIVTLEANVAP